MLNITNTCLISLPLFCLMPLVHGGQGTDILALEGACRLNTQMSMNDCSNLPPQTPLAATSKRLVPRQHYKLPSSGTMVPDLIVTYGCIATCDECQRMMVHRKTCDHRHFAMVAAQVSSQIEGRPSRKAVLCRVKPRLRRGPKVSQLVRV